MSKSPVLFSSDDEDEESYREDEVLRKFQAMLQGVPPPVSVTMCRLPVSEMLSRYKENESSYGFGSGEQNCCRRSSTRDQSTPLVNYLNISQTSEEIASLSQKVQSRYIYSETLSSCNIWFESSVKANSAKKRSNQRNGFRMSPGSRLSHLARRRQIFSCENLQQLANSERRRHIEIKKQDALKSRNLVKNALVENEKMNSFKRALFMSPDEDEKKSLAIKRNLFPSSEKSDSIRYLGTNAPQPSQPSLGVGSGKKRKRMESREGSGNWPRRALTFTEEESNKIQESRNARVISELQLSLHHKSKLLWAVSVTLKEKNMSSKDPHFKTCASALFMICRKNLGKILNSKVEGGTSEKMLHFARQQIDDIFRKLGISPEREKEKVRGETESDAPDDTKDDSGTCEQGDTSANSSKESPAVQTSFNEKENVDVTENCLDF